MAVDLINRKKFRVGGSGFTAFYWNSQPIAFAQSVTVTAPQPVSQPSVIQPLDARYPLQVITTGAVGPGYLDVGLMEMYNEKVWDRMLAAVDSSGAKANDLADVFYALAALGTAINAFKLIIPPTTVGGQQMAPYGDVYNNCVITAIDDGETIDVRKMEVVKNITIAYTHVSRNPTVPSTISQPSVNNLTGNYTSGANADMNGFF